VTYPSAKRHVESLVERGVLRQVGGDKYGKVYLAVEVVRAIEGHEPG
jgi:predicted HTH transcriptional regulator